MNKTVKKFAGIKLERVGALWSLTFFNLFLFYGIGLSKIGFHIAKKVNE